MYILNGLKHTYNKIVLIHIDVHVCILSYCIHERMPGVLMVNKSIVNMHMCNCYYSPSLARSCMLAAMHRMTKAIEWYVAIC